MDDPGTDEKLRKFVYDRVPNTVSDAPALARELLWRVHRENAGLDVLSEEVSSSARKVSTMFPKKKSRLWNHSPRYVVHLSRLPQYMGGPDLSND